MHIIVNMCRKDLPLSEGGTLNCPLVHKNILRDIIDIVVVGSKIYEELTHVAEEGCISGGEEERNFD